MRGSGEFTTLGRARDTGRKARTDLPLIPSMPEIRTIISVCWPVHFPPAFVRVEGKL